MCQPTLTCPHYFNKVPGIVMLSRTYIKLNMCHIYIYPYIYIHIYIHVYNAHKIIIDLLKALYCMSYLTCQFQAPY